MSILDNYYWEWKSIRDKIEELEEENRKLKEAVDIADMCVNNTTNENEKLKLHIEAKDKAYTALLKDYEELKEKNKNLKEKLEKQLWEMLFDVRS